MKVILLFLCSIVCLNYPVSSQTIQFEQKIANVIRDSSKTEDTLKVGLKIISPITGAPQKFQVIDNKFGTAADSEYEFKNQSIELTSNDNFESVTLFLFIKNKAVVGHNIILCLLNPSDSIISTQVVTIAAPSNEQRLIQEAKLTIGANLDALDGIKLNSVYSELNVFIPAKKTCGFGFEAGIYKNQFLSQLDSASNPIMYNPIPGSFKGDSVRAIRELIFGKVRTFVSALGIFFSPNITLYHSGNLSLYGDLHFEVVQRTYTYDSTQTQITSSDSNYYHTGDVINRTPGNTPIVYEGYGGGGLTLRYLSNDIEVRIKFITGTYNSTTVYRGFYLSQFSFTARSFGGLRLGGEVRGFFYPGQSTSVSVYIGKDVPLNQLASFVTGGI